MKTFGSRSGPRRDYITDLNPPDSIIGSPLSELAWGTCQFNSITTKPMKHSAAEEISVPTLLVYGNQDAVREPRALLRNFKQGRLEVLTNLGHLDVWDEANKLQKAFFDE